MPDRGDGGKKKPVVDHFTWLETGLVRLTEQFYIVLRMHVGSRSCSAKREEP